MTTAIIIVGHLLACFAGICIGYVFGYRDGVKITNWRWDQAWKDWH